MKQPERNLPPLDALIAASPYEVALGIGLNEIIVGQGYHPADYGRFPDRAFGGMYAPKESDEWKGLVKPHRIARQYREMN